MRSAIAAVSALLLIAAGAPAQTVAAAGASSGAAPGAERTFAELVAPVLATAEDGGHLLVAQRDRDGTAARGQVVASYLRPGGGRWPAPVPVSSHGRTGPIVDADDGTLGRASVAWTHEGDLYLRSRTRTGAWRREVRVARDVGTWFDLETTNTGIPAVLWLRNGFPHVAWKRPGEPWRRWVGPRRTTQRPQLFWRGPDALTVAWLRGTGAEAVLRATLLRLPDGTPATVATRTVLAVPHVLTYSYGVSPASGYEAVAVVTPGEPDLTGCAPAGATARLTVYADWSRPEPRWAVSGVDARVRPLLDFGPGAFQTTWVGGHASADCAWTTTLHTRNGDSNGDDGVQHDLADCTGCARPHLAHRPNYYGEALVGWRLPGVEQSVARVSRGGPVVGEMLSSWPATDLERVGAPAVSLDERGLHVVAAWTGGRGAHPWVRVRELEPFQVP